MSILLARCGDCSKTIKENEIYQNYDDKHRCRRCDLKMKLSRALLNRKRMLKHFKDVEIKQLKDINKLINSLKTSLDIVAIKERGNL